MRLFFLLILFFSKNIFSQELTPENLQILQSLPEDVQERVINETNINLEPSDITVVENSIEDNQNTENLFFGFDFFNKELTTNAPVLDIPLQADYEISFADELFLLLTGGKDESYSLQVDMAGDVLVPEIGSVSLKDLTLVEAERKLQKIVVDSFAGTEASLSITKAALKKISVIGAVKNPGTFIVNPFISVSEAIKYANGLVGNSSLREVTVSRLNGERIIVDLYEFLIYGDRSVDLNLRNGDTLIINATSNFVLVNGEVQRPNTYEYLDSDKYRDIIKFAQGLTFRGAEDEIGASFFLDKKQISRTIDLEENIKTESLVSIFIPSKALVRDKNILVVGAAVNDGIYNAEKYILVEDLVNDLKFTEDIYPFYFHLEQEDKNGEIIERKNLSLYDKESYKGLKIKDNAIFTFLDRGLVKNNSLNAELLDYALGTYVQINLGTQQFLLPIFGKFSAEKLYDYLGEPGVYNFDFANVAFEDVIELAAFEKEFVATPNTVVNIPVFNDIKISVEIQGQVRFPGTYVVNNFTTLQDIYDLAGGLTARSDTSAIFLSRQSNKIKEKASYETAKNSIIDSLITSLNNSFGNELGFDLSLLSLLEKPIVDFPGRLSGELSPKSMTAENTYLENGDLIVIPPMTNSISVLGQVLSPGSIVYNSKYEINDFIEQSGGYTQFADRNSTYILKSNGTATTDVQNFFKLGYEIKPGDSIIVPRNLEKISTLPLITYSAQIISDIAISAASLNAIRN